MAIFKCTKCGQKLRIPDGKRGVAKCPKCSTRNYVGVSAYGYVGVSAYEHILKRKKRRLNVVSAGSSSKSSKELATKNSNANSSNSWYLLRALVLSCILGVLIYSSLQNPSANDYANFGNSSFAALLETEKSTNNFSVPEVRNDVKESKYLSYALGGNLVTQETNDSRIKALDSIEPSACHNLVLPNILSKKEIIGLFNEQTFKKNSFNINENLVLPAPKISPPKKEIILLAVVFFISGFFLSRSQIGANYKDFCLVYPAVLLLAIGGSWIGANQLSSKANQTKSLDYYKTTLLSAEKIFSLLTPWLYETSPIADVNDRYVYSSIIELLGSGDSNSAVNFANARTNNKLESIAQLAHYTHAIESYKNGQIKPAALAIFKARNSGDGPSFLNTAASRILNEYAVYLNTTGEFNKSLNLKSKLDHNNSVDGYDDYAWLNLYKSEIQSKYSNFPNNPDTSAKLQNTTHGYLKSASLSSPLVNNYFRCELSEIHLDMAKKQLVSQNANAAITEIHKAHSIVKPDRNTTLLLSKSLDLKGIQAWENGEIDESISSFTGALASDKQNEELKCRLALAKMTKAVDLAYIGRFDELDKLTGEALSLCPNDSLEEMGTELFVIEAKWNFRRGQLDRARKLLSTVKNSSHRSLARYATTLLNDSYQSRSRYSKLVEASKWADKIPRITGSACNIDPTTGKCDSVILYDGDRVLGKASMDFSYVEIKDFESSIYLKDTVRDGRFDTYELTDKQQTRRLHEKDGDYLLDREVVFDAHGTLIKDEKYSGQIFMKFPSGAIKSGCDSLSSCDAYLIVNHNGRYIGATRPSINTQFPIWNTGAALNYKKGDNVTITMMDYDQGFLNRMVDAFNYTFETDIDRDEDDYIDDFPFRKLPETGIWTGIEKNAQIYLKVSPTSAPTGMYDWDNSEHSNLFKYYTSDSYNEGILDNIVQGARDTEEYHAFTSKAAAWTLPEIALMPFFGRGKFIQGFLASMAASEVTEKALENRDDIKID